MCIVSYVLYIYYIQAADTQIQSEHQNYIDSICLCTAILYGLAMDLIVYSALECLVTENGGANDAVLM